MAERTWKSYCKHADALLDMGRAEEAFQSARRALALDIQQSEAWFEACRALLALDRAEEALRHADEGLQRKPDSSWGHRLRSTALSMLTRYSEALEEADEALRLTPEEPLAMRRRARCLYTLDRDEEALEQVDGAIAKDPESHYGYSLRSAITLYLKRFDEAEEAARTGLELSPGNVELLSRLGDILRKKGSNLEAMAAYRDAVRSDPTDARPKRGMKAAAEALRSQGYAMLLVSFMAAGVVSAILLSLVLSDWIHTILYIVGLLGGLGLGVWANERRLRWRVERLDPGLWELWRRVEKENL
ncbi:MAG: tetratricopeptide (TPR) repeat protein [Myxococcota bacterium]|jgi:tetratricopeptide (TPR) repeat protein